MKRIALALIAFANTWPCPRYVNPSKKPPTAASIPLTNSEPTRLLDCIPGYRLAVRVGIVRRRDRMIRQEMPLAQQYGIPMSSVPTNTAVSGRTV